MKKIIITLIAALALGLSANAQMYDGITQPTKYRVWLMTNIPGDGGNANFTPFVGYRQDIAQWLNVTGWAQYNFATQTLTPAVWLNFNIANRFYVLSRSIVDLKNGGNYRHGLAATLKIAAGFHMDCTWDNLLNRGKFADGDRLQVLAGWGGKKVVVNGGYSMRAFPGFVCNVRYKLTDMLWSQLKYDGGLNAYAFSLVYHWN